MTNQTNEFSIILASQSPRRAKLLESAGFKFVTDAPDDSVERGICSKCSPEDLVLQSAFLKARAIAPKHSTGVIIAADTVAECQGEILGKPVDREHAEKMLMLMSGKKHRVLTGICLWKKPGDCHRLHLEQSVLTMDVLEAHQLEEILDSDNWIGKAGAFGYQDGLDWLHLESGLESNVVGLPIERLNEWIGELLEMS
ncbi:MAG: Maf-like protein [Planctomycetaceae bacterium]|nr:Maf-like protein [Planctomycetaceae bacterium]MCP4478696.1 Maf-like protein [Planctomycetaceae bacterium]MCP4773690.1 Maf-like protein [Planctomycetaceae bacterium]